MISKHFAWMLLRLLGVIAFIIVTIWFIFQIFSLTYPFWIAAFFAWLLKPISQALQKKLKFPPGIAALTALLLAIVLFGGIITALIYLIANAIQRFAEHAPQWAETISSNIQQFFNEFFFPFIHQINILAEDFTPDESYSIHEGLSELGSQIGNAIGQLAQRFADNLTQVALSVPTFLVAFLFVFLAIYFLGKDWELISNWFKRKLPDEVKHKGSLFYEAMWDRVFGFIKAQAILMSITGLIVLIGLLILQIDAAFTLAIVVGLFEFVPYLGTGTILIPWAVYLLLTGSFGLGIGIAILYGVALIVRQTIEPKVLSTSMNLNPLAVLISLFAGLKLFGAMGLFVGPALLVVLVILVDIGVGNDLKRFIKDGFS